MYDKVVLVTYPERNRRGANKRVMVMRTPEGEELAWVDTRWTLVDTTCAKIVRTCPRGDRPPLEPRGGVGAVPAGAQGRDPDPGRDTEGGLLRL